jgi:hypothetical protein
MNLFRKILDPIFSCIINSRIVQDRKKRRQAIKEEKEREMLSSSVFWLGPPIMARKEMKAFFSNAFLSGPLEGLKPYPEKFFLKDFNVYYVHFLLDNSLVPGVLSLIEELFPIALGKEDYKLLAENTEKERMICVWERKYGGMVYALFTSSSRFIRRLDELHPQPPLPWVTYPDVDAETLNPRSADHDWFTLWFDFWRSLTSQEKRAFLNQHRAAYKSWMHFIQWYGDHEYEEYEEA